MITILKIAAYDTGKSHPDRYAYACQLLNQQLDPPSQQPHTLTLQNPSSIFCSTLLRAQQSIPEQYQHSITYTTALNEVPFELAEFVNAEEFATEGSNAVRAAFVEAFLQDTLNLSRAHLKTQTITLLQKLTSLPSTDHSYAISHSFRMKILQAFILSNGTLFEHPELIKTFLPMDHKTFAFNTGFTVTPEQITTALQNH